MSLIIAFQPLFLKICDLQERVASTLAGGLFQSLMVPFTKEYFPISFYFIFIYLFISPPPP